MSPSRAGNTRRLGLEGVEIQRHEGLKVRGADTECARRVRGRPRKVRPQGGVRQQPAERGREVGLRRARQHRAREVAETLPRVEPSRHVMFGLGGADAERGPVRGRDVGRGKPSSRQHHTNAAGVLKRWSSWRDSAKNTPRPRAGRGIRRERSGCRKSWMGGAGPGRIMCGRPGSAQRLDPAQLCREVGRGREFPVPLEDHGRPWR